DEKRTPVLVGQKQGLEVKRGGIVQLRMPHRGLATDCRIWTRFAPSSIRYGDCWSGSAPLGIENVAEQQVRTIAELRAGSLSKDDVDLELVRGDEAISTPFHFQLAFRPAAKGVFDLADLVGATATLTLRRPGGDEQSIHGVLSRVALDSVSVGRPGYTASLVPRFALLEQSRDSRVFQNQTVPDIARSVLDGHGVRMRSSLSTQYARREFCVQYRESDLAFVSRLLEAEGIFYFFDH